MSEKLSIEQWLEREESVTIMPEGYSMYPTIVPGRDQVVLKVVDPGKVRRGDVVLYSRDDQRKVLHRVCAVKDDCFYAVGDNQTKVEGPLELDRINGILVAFERKGKKISATDKGYIAYGKIWLFLRPVRRPIQLAGATVKRLIGRM